MPSKSTQPGIRQGKIAFLLLCGVIMLWAFLPAVFQITEVSILRCEDDDSPIDLTTFVSMDFFPMSYESCDTNEITQLFFSEYLEGSSNNKCLEIYNGTHQDVNFATGDFLIHFFLNGSSTASRTIDLNGIVPANQTFVVCDNNSSMAILDIADTVSTTTFFNGDDAILLIAGGDTLDVIGQIGIDPGSRWGTTLFGTQNRTLIRNPEVYVGDTIGGDVFNPMEEWMVMPQDDINDLGFHEVVSTLSCITIVNPASYIPSFDSLVQIISENADVGVIDTTYISFDRSASDVTEINENICQGDSILFDGQFIKLTGIYQDTISRIGQCDSIIILTINVLDTFATNITETICDGDSVLLGTTYYKSTGTYAETFPADNGCDSTVTLELIVLPILETILNDTICVGDLYEFDGEELSIAGEYRDTVPSSTTCDSIIILQLELYEEVEVVPVDIVLCESETDSVNLESVVLTLNRIDYTYTFQKVDQVIPRDIFISEYMEGSSNNKCIELYNGTGAAVDLAEYTLEFFSNGSISASSSIPLTGSISIESTFIICDDGEALSVMPDQTSGVTFYNGDDAIVLLNGSDTVDVIGRIGEDPGSAWTDMGISTQNQTLRRKASILAGDTVTNDIFIVSEEWGGFPIDDVSGFGSHAVIDSFSVTPLTNVLRDAMDGDSVVFIATDPATDCMDSTYITFEVLPTRDTILNEEICANSSYSFDGEELTMSGTFRDTMISSLGCDSIITLMLNVLDTFATDITETICDGDSVLLGATYYKSTGTYIETFPADNGCDSTVTLELTVLPILETIINDTICVGDLYEFDGEELSTAGEYRDTVPASTSCDSIIILQLELYDEFEVIPVEAVLCASESDSVSLESEVLVSNRIEYTYDFRKVDRVLPDDLFISEYMEGSSNNKCLELYNGTGTAIDLAGYTLELYNNGSTSSSSSIPLTGSIPNETTFIICDEDVALAVTPNQTSGVTFYNGDDAIVLLNGNDTIDVIGRIGEDPGNAWTDVGISTQNQTLRRKASILTGDTITNDTFIVSQEWEGFPQDEVSGFGSHNVNDSLEVTPLTNVLREVMDGDSVVFVATDPATGCMNSSYITFEVLPTRDTILNEEICANSSYSFDGEELTMSGTYRDTVMSILGCDSIIILMLNVLDTFATDITETICDGDSVLLGATYYKSTGTYTETFPAGNGCDSTVTLDLTVLPILETMIQDTICLGDVYEFDGEELSIAGEYRDTVPASTTCDSIIILQLELYDEVEVIPVEVVLCESEAGSVNLESEVLTSNQADYTYGFRKVDKVLPRDIFISEYMEGSSNNKCIELYNGIGTAIDLTDYRLEFYNNGSISASSSITLAGSISNESTFIVCDEDVALGVIPDQTSGVTFYNGDDAIVLLNGSDTVDVIGSIGEDPGSAWTDMGISTQNQTLRRKSSILAGDTIANDVFIVSQEWDGFPQDDVSGFGGHTVNDSFEVTPLTNVLRDVMDGDSVVFVATDPASGCMDSSYMTFELLPTRDTILNEEICANSSYSFDGEELTMSGTYSETVMSSLGCDSIIVLNLTVNGTSVIEESISICEGDSIVRGDSVLKTPGVFEFNNLNSAGCDSLTIIDLTVLEIDSVIIEQQICKGDSLLFNEDYYDETGEYVSVSIGSNGCDSITILGLMVTDQIVERLDDLTLCIDSIVDVTMETGVHITDEDILKQERLIRPREIFISEYIEGSGFNKCIEIYNPTDSTINLSAYQLEIYINGAATPSTSFSLTGSVPVDSAFVICDDSAADPLLEKSDFLISTSWNGDDAIVLRKEAQVIDVFGRVGEDPGSRWGSGSLSSVNNTLIRISSIQEGDTLSSDAFLPADEWSSSGLDDISNLGIHLIDEIVEIDTILNPMAYQPSKGVRELQLISTNAVTSCPEILIIPTHLEDCGITPPIIQDTVDVALVIDTILVGDSSIQYEVTISNQGNTPVSSLQLSSLIKRSNFLVDTVLNITLLPGDESIVLLQLENTNELVFADQLLGVFISELMVEDSIYKEDKDGLYGDVAVEANHVDCVPFSVKGDVTVIPPSAPYDLYCSDGEVPDSITINPNAVKYTEALFIASYIEGSQSDKCLSLYNHTGRVESLKDYTIEIYTNGSNTPSRTLELSGDLQSDEVFIICNEAADSSLLIKADLLDNRVMIFNGDDALVVKKRGQIVDVFGRVGEDPGTRWAADGIESRDIWLMRDIEVNGGDRSSTDTFIISNEWAEVDTFYDFTSHEVMPDSIKEFSFYNAERDLFANGVNFTFSATDLSLKEVFISSIDGIAESETTRYVAAVQLGRTDLSCKGEVVVSVEANCKYSLSPSLFLTGEFIPEFYSVQVSSNGRPVEEADLFQYEDDELTYTITDSCSYLQCWGTLKIVRDVVPIVQDCKCDSFIDSPDEECILLCTDTIPRYQPVMVDNCTGDTLQVPLQFVDREIAEVGSRNLYRTWLDKGDTVCTQRFVIESFDFDNIVAPKDSVLADCYDLNDIEGLSNLSYELVPWLIQNGDSIIFDSIGRYCNVKVEVEDFVNTTTCIGAQSLSRLWMLVDGKSGRKDTFYQHLETVDITPPTFELAAHPFLSSSGIYEAYVYDPIVCKAEFILPEVIDLYDNCSSTEDLRIIYELPDGTTRKDSLIYGLEDAVNRVTIKVTDDCGNSSSKLLLITVRDKAPPHPVCRSIELHTMNIYIDGVATIPLEVFDEASWDNCGVITTRLGRRLDNKSTCRGERLTFVSTRELQFCCEDIGKTIPVSLTLIDAGGNRSECIVEVIVNESEQFKILNDTLRVDCYASSNPDILGYPITNSIVCFPPRLNFQDSLIDQNPCEPIQIIRTWYDNSSMQSDQQVILRERSNSFHPIDIKWPLHYNGETHIDKDHWPVNMHDPLSCQEVPLEGVVLDPYHCKLIGMSYEDIGVNDNGSCQPYYREWTVIDWCLFDVNDEIQKPDQTDLCFDSLTMRHYFKFDSTVIEDGFYTFQQEIYVEDDVPPFINNLDIDYVWDEEICLYKSFLQFSVRDTGACSSDEIEFEIYNASGPRIDGQEGIASNGDIVHSETIASDQDLINIVVRDECGNTFNDTMPIFHPDHPQNKFICLASISTVLDATGTVELWIDEIVMDYDNCYNGDIYFSNNGILLDSIILDCSDFHDGQTEVELYDENISFICSATVSVANFDSCKAAVTTQSESRSGDMVEGDVTIFPNPFSNQTRIQLPKDVEADMLIYDSFGQLIYRKEAFKEKYILHADNLKGSGIYLLKFKTSRGREYQQRIILTR